MTTTRDDASVEPRPEWQLAQEVDAASILFAGDTGFGGNYAKTQNLGIDDLHEGPFEHLDGLLSSADLVIANLETVFTAVQDSPLAGKRPYLHFDDPELGPAQLSKHNIHAVTFANNHIMDMGQQGFLDTLDTLQSHGITYAGAGRSLERAAEPLRIRVPLTGGGHRSVTVIAGFRSSASFDALTESFATADRPGCNPLKTSETAQQIRAVRQERPDDFIVVVPHWRRDYQWASDAQRKFARDVTAAGADIVIGHGSHMAQEIDIANGRPILHGIGNFLFNSKGRYQKLGVPPFSIAVRLHLTAREASLRLYPIHTDNRVTGFRTHPVTEEQFEEFYLTSLERTADSAAFLRAVGTGQDAVGSYLEIPLKPNRRAHVNRSRRGSTSIRTYWEDEPVAVRFDRRTPASQFVLERELRRQGATIRQIDKSTLAGHSKEGNPYLVRASVTSNSGTPGVRAVKQKDLARRILQSAGANVADGDHFRDPDDFDAAVALMEKIGPVVVKPVDGNIGRGVTVGVDDVEALRHAWTLAFSETTTGVLLERQFEGDEFRISVVDGVACAVTKRVPPQVTGDGKKSIRELINERNDARHRELVLHSKPIDLVGHRLRRLLDAGLTPLSVLPAGETYIIDHMGSVGSGAHPVHCIEDIDESYLRSAERAARAFPDIDNVGIDMLCTDTSVPATEENHIIIEVNSKPEVATHAAAPSPRAPQSFPTKLVASLLTPREYGPLLPRIATPARPTDPTSAQLLAAEFEARGLTLTWWSNRYFQATAGDRYVSCWGSTTDRTSSCARTVTRRDDLSQMMLRRARLPRITEDSDTTGRTPLRFLVAHGRVLAVIDDSDPDRTGVLRRIHQSYRAVAAACVAAFPGLDLAEVSLLVRDPRTPAVKKETGVESVRTEPDLVEWTAAAGNRTDIVRTIVDLHLGGEEPAPEPEVEWAPASAAKSREASDGSTIGGHARRFARAVKRRIT